MNRLLSHSSDTISEKFVIYENPELATDCFPNMREIRRQGKLCDITIKVSETQMKFYRKFF